MFRFLKAHWLTLLILFGMLAGTVYVVKTKRPPGAMTVIESQAMDMKVMKPPVGTVPVALETVAREPFRASVTYTGTVVAWADEDIVARVTGRVVEMPVYPGDHVQAGQVVARLDSVELSALEASSRAGAGESLARTRSALAMLNAAERQLEAAESQVDVARAEREEAVAEIESADVKLKYWDAELKRARGLYQEGAVSLEELQQVEAEEAEARVMVHHKHVGVKAADAKVAQAGKEAAAARAEVARAQAEAEAAGASVARARADLEAAATVRDYTVIRSQSAGDVTERVVSPGTLVMPGTVVLRIKKVDRLRLQARVPSSEAGRIRPGARVWARPRSGGEPLETTVSSVFRAADPSSRTVTVEAVIPNPVPDRATLYPGDYVEMEIALDGPSDALTIPLRALRKDLEGKDFAWVVQRAPAEPGQTKYTCVMHPEVVMDHPGKCPKCKMDLVPQERTGDLKAHRQPVKAGPASGTRVAILEGLKAGDEVIVQGYQDLVEGTAVAAVPWGPEGPVELPEATTPMEGMPGHEGHGATTPAPGHEGHGATTPAPGHEGHTAAPAPGDGDGMAPGHEGHTAAPGAGTEGSGHEGHTMPSPSVHGGSHSGHGQHEVSPGQAVYTCPMHPEVKSDQPGSCPKCGMDLVKEAKP